MRHLFILIFALVSTPLFSLESKNSDLDLIISKEEIVHAIESVSASINQQYKDTELHIIMIMKGCICLAADLIRNLDVPFQLHSVKASSYGMNGTVGQDLTLEGLEKLSVEGKDILLIDDIYETGATMKGVKDHIAAQGARSVKTLVLLLKDIPRTRLAEVDYALFHIPNRFVVGYGLDYKELYRGLPAVYAFPGDKPPF